MTNTPNMALLPSGFADLLPPDAAQEARMVSGLMTTFEGFGYQRVKPPLAEFEDSLFAPGPGASLASESFRIMDPVSHRMLGVRSDITAQIARIASSRLSEEPRPLRLMYANDVLRTKATQQRTLRQFCQAGCEIIGCDSVEADIEMTVLAALSLHNLGVQDLTIDLTLPRLLLNLFKAHDVDEDEQPGMREAVKNRDIGRLDAMQTDLSTTLKTLVQASGAADQALDKAAAVKLPEEAARDLELLGNVYAGVSGALSDLKLDDVKITIDFSDASDLEYHRGVSFALFCPQVSGELGRGGRYDIFFGDDEKSESAAGFTLYMDTVRRTVEPPAAKDIVFVPADVPWSDLCALREKGWIVKREAGQDGERKNCTHEYINGEVKDI